MPISSYAELRQTAADWLARTDLTADLPTCVALAESRINRELSKVGAGELASSSLVTVGGTPTVALPSDFNGSRMVAVQASSQVTPLVFLPPEELYFRYSSTGGGVPRAFAVIGSDGVGGVQNLLLRPTPDAAYPLTLIYYKAVPTLVGGADAGTNWFLAKHPDAMLYAVLLEAAARVASPEDVQMWRAGLQQAFDDIKAQDRKNRWSGATLRVGNSSRLTAGC
jgi:hypothetical protein